MLLAASLDNLALRPGTRLGLISELDRGNDVNTMIWDWDTIVKIALVFTVVVLTVSVILIVLSPDLRQRLGKYVVQMFVFLIIYAVALSFAEPREAEELEVIEDTTPASEMVSVPQDLVAEDQAPIVFEPPEQPSPWLVYVVGLIFALAVVLVGVWLWRLSHQPEQQLEAIAKAAVRDLSQGRAWEDTVIQCYAEMNGVLNKRRGIQRQVAMTPSEFAERLVTFGFPQEAVMRLTRLFERARYGSRESSPVEANEAMICLTDIVQSVRGRS
jgi:Ca2+/Na+ antiporter